MIAVEDNSYLPYVTFVPVAYLVAFLVALAGVLYSVSSLLAMTESYSKSGGDLINEEEEDDARVSKKMNFLENVLPLKCLLTDTRLRHITSTKTADPVLLPYNITRDHLLEFHDQVVDTGLQERYAKVQFKHHRSENNLEKIEDQLEGGTKAVKSGKDCLKITENTTKMFEIPTKKVSNFKIPSKKVSNFKIPTKKDSNLKYPVTKSNYNLKVTADPVEPCRATKLLTQCTEKSQEKLFERDRELDQYRDSVVNLQSYGFVMKKEDLEMKVRNEEVKHQTERVGDNDHFQHTISPSMYSLFRSPPLSHINPSPPNQDTLDETSSIILGLGDLNELRDAESILSFDGDLQKIPYYRQLI